MTERSLQPVSPSSSPPSSPPAFLYGAAVIGAGETVASIGDALTAAVLAPASGGWRLAVVGTLAPILVWIALRPSVPAAFGAAGAGWWIGIAAGCLMISGLLLLADVAWRCGIARLAQSAALLGAGLAALHPVPVHPVSLAALLVAGFGLWAAALLPDLAVLRDRLGAGPHRRRARLYRALSLGWRGSALQWLVWERACRGLALLGILAAVAVLIDLALAATLRTDRHDTLLPVALLVEAVLSGAGLIAALAVVLRRSLGLGGLVTGRHLDILGRLILAFGLAALYCHVTEIVTAVLYGDAAERARLTRRLLGDEAPAFWTFMLAGLLPTQFFWIPAIRRSPAALGLTGALVACGLGADHVLAARIGAAGTGLPDLLPELVTAGAAALGSVGLFVLGLLLLFRLVPPVSIAETRRLALLHNPQAGPSAPAIGQLAGRGAVQEPVQGAAQGTEQAARLRTDRDPSPGLAAVFASEAGLAEAARELSASDAPPRLDAFGPVPMPEAAAALHRDERSLNRFALSGAFLAAAAYIVVRAAGFAGELPGGIADGLMGVAVSAWTLSPSLSSLPVLPPVWPLSWAMAAVPALSAAVAGGSVGIAVALLRALRGARTGRPLPSVLAGHFLLTVEPASEPFNPAALARRLTSLPASAGRPLAVYGPAVGRPLR